MRGLLGVLVVLLCASPALGTTFTAASCSQADVHAQLILAGLSDATLDTVVIPAGTCTWASAETISSKSIILQGAGAGTRAQCDVGGQTTFTCIRGTTPLLKWTTKATGGNPRLTAISWLNDAGTTGCASYDTGTVTIWGTSATLRVDHNYFNVIGSTGNTCNNLVFPGRGTNATNSYVRGVVDHNTFVLSITQAHSISISHSSWGSVGNFGDNSWAQDSTLGNSNAMYVEDNTFTVDGLTGLQAFSDDANGARYVYRFNTITDGVFANHGTETAGRDRGFRHAEYYNNTMTWTGANTPDMVGFRGGTGMVFDNTVTGSVTNIVSLSTFRRDDLVSTHSGGSYPFGRCGQLIVNSVTRSGSTATATTDVTTPQYSNQGGGSYEVITGANEGAYNGVFITHGLSPTQSDTVFTYTVAGTPTTPATGTIRAVSPFDSNTDSTGYRCMDQAGAGKGALVAGDGPGGSQITIAGVSPESGGGPVGNALEPIYIWNNLINSALNPGWAQSATSIIVANREFYNQCAVGQTCVSFNGTVGIGRGLRSARPATCTTGVAYAATDGGTWNNGASSVVLDKCTSTNTWTNGWYTPLPYPHSLVNFVPPPSGPTSMGSHGPAPPTGLRFRNGIRSRAPR